MLTDSLVLAGAGGMLGIVLAIVSAPLVARLVPSSLPIAEVPSVDLRMLFGAGLLTLATGLVFGVLPALRACRSADGSALKEGARGGTSRGTERLRSALVVAEIVASVVLLVSAGLLIQALLRVQAVDPGFKTTNVLTLRTMLPAPKYRLTTAREQFYQRVLGEVHALPGVANARLHQLPADDVARRHLGDPDDGGGSEQSGRIRRSRPARPAQRQHSLCHAGILRRDRHADPARARCQRE